MRSLFHLLLLFLVGSTVSAQPTDAPYQFVIFDPEATHMDWEVHPTKYQVYAAAVSYYSNDYRQTSWTMDPRSIHIQDTLELTKAADTLLPFTATWTGRSYLHSQLIIIIRNQKDTMWLDGAGANLVSDYYGTQELLPAIIPFRVGIHKLFKMQAEKEYRQLQNLVYRNYYLHQETPQINVQPWVRSITQMDLNQTIYSPHDSITLHCTGTFQTDGSCRDQKILYIVQHKTADGWTSTTENMTQMDCGAGSRKLEQETQFKLTLLAQPDDTTSINPKTFASGLYRIVVFDENYLP